MLISAAGNVDLESVQATSENTSSSSAGGVAVGYSWGFDVDKNQVSAGFTANASGSEGQVEGSSVTQVNSNVVGSNTVTVTAGDTLTLAGALLSGTTVNASAVNGIVIQSRQDIASYDEKTKSAQLGISSGVSAAATIRARSPATMPIFPSKAASLQAPAVITSIRTGQSIQKAASSARLPIQPAIR